MLWNMETTGTKAQEAFNSAQAGKRVGVLARLTNEFADELYQCYRDLSITERLGVRVARRHASLELDWDNGGKLVIHPNPDFFRGWTLDLMYHPEYAVERARATVLPTVLPSGGKVVEY